MTGSKARYDPFGTFTATPTGSNPSITNRGFTGHRHNNTGTYDLGLIYMNARYSLPEVGRFISPDTLIPDPGNPQSHNRYSYVLNSPVNFTDPSGHKECSPIAGGECRPLSKPPRIPSGPAISFEGEDWTQAEQTTGNAAGGRVESALARVMNKTHFGWSLTSEEALKLVHGGKVTFTRTGESCANATGVASNSCWGRATSRTTIEVYLDAGDAAENDRWFVHELGHTFEASVGNSLPSKALQQAQDADTTFPNRVAGPDGIVDPTGTWGFAGPRWTWQQSASPTANEEFADMYIGWVYGQFANTTDGQMRSAFMDGYMSLWIDLALGQ